ncbi:dUTP diphosphatase [Mycoplasma enhydrae]|uniref:dUTP diphosphatase n=1 Tax=Mycoplasma enhydrae TaxID=2499220 RepID=UPI0021E8DF0E|nr:dUTP diphosphatase [Mycoplasma enhydrae]MCV3733555.1 dUTP diphosphatase [Mycoplasma enhydrae]MCV3753469.1 dUTP diphosphatase [Mycoplasma enhydrae]
MKYIKCYNFDIMELHLIFEAQKTLDKTFINNIEKEDLELFDTKKVIALLVELGEFANEVKAFKYWKKDKNIDRKKLLEEFADGIHFITSLAYQMEVPSKVEPKIRYDNFNLQLAHTYKLFCNLLENKDKKSVQEAFEVYLGLGQLVDINEKDIIESYLYKNKKNYQRIKERY